MRYPIILMAAYGLFLSPDVFADSRISGDEIVVTATRTAQTADETLASVSVITREDIENSLAKTLVELLRLAAGIDTARTGGPAQQTSIFMRGSNSDHTLVLIDGIRANSGTTGSFPWEKISLTQIERIEIVRGPRSVLYGSEAIGGVVQIFTRRPEKPTWRIEGGSFGTYGASVATSTGEAFKIYINANYRSAEGYSATNPNSGTSYDPDNDGYINRGLSLAAKASLSEDTKLDVNLWNAVNSDEFDVGTHESTNRTASTRLTTTQSASWTHTLMLGHITDDLVTDSAFPSRVLTRRNTAEWQHDFSFSDTDLFSAGIGHSDETASNDSAPFNTSIYNTAMFVDWRKRLGNQNIELGLRRDHHSTFGDYTTGQLAWGRKLDKRWRLRASYGSAFKAPDQNELYHPGFSGWFAGNPLLQPETSLSAEIGLRLKGDNNTSIEASIYNTAITNLIAYQGINNQAININSTSLQGLELSYTHALGKWYTQTHLTLQRAQDESTGTDLLRRPVGKLSLRMDRRLAHGGNFGVEFVAASKHADFDNITFSTIDVPGYVVVNLSLRHALNRDWILEGRIENLLDERYEIVSGYNTTPRSLLLALRYAPNNR